MLMVRDGSGKLRQNSPSVIASSSNESGTTTPKKNYDRIFLFNLGSKVDRHQDLTKGEA
jgi:hypothetical protein